VLSDALIHHFNGGRGANNQKAENQSEFDTADATVAARAKSVEEQGEVTHIHSVDTIGTDHT
jgi:hypothetical protein